MIVTESFIESFHESFTLSRLATTYVKTAFIFIQNLIISNHVLSALKRTLLQHKKISILALCLNEFSNENVVEMF